VFAEQKVHFGRGPRQVDVICVAIGSVDVNGQPLGERGNSRVTYS
jgi:hypothetical protein